ncbi:Methyltransferase domain-containing protein [Marininema mesophilum]|uniref:Methyltransferase domain-containing protein n=1 Tax=Marininema mesophilum TaxID=1048340 RepID=A0A1H2VLH6_9BACL|nr:class I SAM-dependent methyltransferase [Marininema mesophilum]SDW69182.1 Methyltransferase domain-containing protein [Marininema mesophilum]
MKQIFTDIYRKNRWADPESSSGTGSNHKQTRVLVRALPRLLHQYKIRSILDAPCGDFHWMKEVAPRVPHYIGGDIVPDLIQHNRKRFAAPNRTFRLLDITRSRLPCVDLIFCRDCFVHFSFAHIQLALANFKQSGSSYLLTTTFPRRKHHTDSTTGHNWRPINLLLPPFRFPTPLVVINEGCTEFHGKFADKSLALWKLSDIRITPHR